MSRALLFLVLLPGCALLDAAGGGGFDHATVEVNTGNLPIVRLLPAHLDPGGALDLIAIDAQGRVWNLYGLGDPNRPFEAKMTNLVVQPGQANGTQFPKDVAAGDYNFDGLDDLVAVSGGQLVLFTNDGARGYVQPGVALAGGAPGQALIIKADLESDGDDDLVALDAGAGSTSVVSYFQDGGVLNLGTTTVLPNPMLPHDLGVGDFTSDGRADVITVLSDVSLLASTGSGGFTSSSISSLGGDNPVALAVGGFDGEPPDVAIAVDSLQGDYVEVIFQPAAVGGAGTRSVRIAEGVSGDALAALDFDGDGRLDVVRVDGRGGSDHFARFFRNAGMGFDDAGEISDGTITGVITSGEMTGDGKDDLAIAEFNRPGSILVFSAR